MLSKGETLISHGQLTEVPPTPVGINESATKSVHEVDQKNLGDTDKGSLLLNSAKNFENLVQEFDEIASKPESSRFKQKNIMLEEEYGSYGERKTAT